MNSEDNPSRQKWISTDAGSDFLYIRLADEVEKKIESGTYFLGEKLPSIRRLADQLSLSISTVYQSFIELEKRGIVESRPKSGYFVRMRPGDMLPEPSVSRHKITPKAVRVSDVSQRIHEVVADPSILPLGAAVISPELLPLKQLASIMRSLSRNRMAEIISYGSPLGHEELRIQISKWMLGVSNDISPEKIVITAGCVEAMSVSLRAVAGPGDTVAIESPIYSDILHIVEDLKMMALEIPSDPKSGLNLNALVKALDQNEVKALLCVPNFSNPLGAVMPDANKKKLVEIMTERNIPIIEDDISGDLDFSDKRPVTLKSFDKEGLVLYCSSFSKTLSSGLRVGWVVPGRLFEKVLRYKRNNNVASPTLNQMIIAEYLKTGGYGRHLRLLRRELKKQVYNTSLAIARSFPRGTKITSPSGGFLLWVQLPKKVDGLELFHNAMEHQISIIPGTIFSAGHKYRNYIRISCGYPWSESLQAGIDTLGRLIRKQMA